MSKRVTLQDIANKLGYSKNTISLALRNSSQIPFATREKIQRTAKDMGYQSNAIVSQLMAELRSSQSPKFQAKLALFNANEDPNALSRHPTIPTYVEGCKRRATQLGYSFDSFWMHEPKMSANRFIQILNTRSIRGIVIVGLMGKNNLPPKFTPIWEAFPSVVTGVRTRNPTLSFASVDHHVLTLRAIERLHDRGYRRPAIVVDDAIDKLVERRFSAGYLIGQSMLTKANRLPPFMNYRQAKADPSVFKSWIRDQKPDVVLSLYHSTYEWLLEMGYHVPADIGFAQLERRHAKPEFAGMDQNNDVAGEAAVDMVISQIHNNEKGIPEFPRSTLIGSIWKDSETVKSQD